MARPAALPAGDALECLLRLKGREWNRQARPPAAAPGETLAAILEAEGLPARAVRIRAGDLVHLDLPTLARHRDGAWLVLKARARGGFLVLGGDGPVALGAGELQGILAGEALELVPGLSGGGNLWRRLGALALTRTPALALALAATVLLQVLALGQPALTKVVLDRALPDGAGSLLGLVVAGSLLMGLCHTWIDLVRGRALLFFSQRFEQASERGLLAHILALPFPRLRGQPLGAWLQAFDGLAAARGLLAEKTLGVLLDGALALLLLAAMAALLPGATALVAGAALVLAAGAALAGRAEASLQAREVRVAAGIRSALAELLAGVATVKAAGAEGECLRGWRRRYREGLALAVRRGRLALGAGTFAAGLGRALETGLLVWGGLQVLHGVLGLGAFLAFLQLAAAFMAAAQGLAGTWAALQVLAPQVACAAEILAQPPMPRAPYRPPSATPGPVRMDGVWFRYREDGPWVLAGQDLALEPGAKRWLSGPSGWGKSTLLRLLAGLEAPDRGTVRIAGQPPAAGRHRRLYLPQFPQLFAGSILENLALLSGGAPPAALLAAAEATGLGDWVSTLPMGYRTPLPPGGGSLSGGQRQWLALTAALASGRGILLLDEPMANLDPIIARRLAEALEAGPWTMVAAGHRSGAG